MTKYIGIKVVTAEPMTAGVAKTKGYRTDNAEEGVEGVEVTYEGGYKSWCPKDVFETYNFEIKNEQLVSTCKLMCSADYKERFLAEYIQLHNRTKGLERMCEKWDNGTLPFVPTCGREIYTEQLEAMNKYLKVLERRAWVEGINLPL